MRSLIFTLFVCFSLSAAQQQFKTISLEEFGAIPNQQKCMQPDARIKANTIRTNNWQNLQLIDPIAYPNRVGPYLITKSDEGIGIGFPYQVNNDGVALISQSNYLIVSCKEKNGNPDLSMNIPSTESMSIDYQFGAARLTDFNVTGSAYHDVRFENATPTVHTSSGIITKITTYLPDGTKSDLTAVPNAITQPGTAFEITIAPLTTISQTWLVFVEPEGKTLQLQVDATQTTLTALATGDLLYLRFAILQPEPVAVNVTAPPATPRCWSTAALIQTIAPTPVSMYSLWPADWVKLFAAQFTKEYDAGYEIPSQRYISLLLPVLARVNFDQANSLLAAIKDSDIDEGTSRFLTYFNMVIARDQEAQINAYQTKRAAAQRVYPAPPSLDEVRQALFASRHSIPIKCDLLINASGISWVYQTDGNIQNPLVCFPAYHSVNNTLGQFFVQDPIKGPLYSALATGNTLSVDTPSLPDWFPSSLFPSDLSLTPAEIELLTGYYEAAKNQPLDLKNSYYRGKQIHGLALAVKYRELLSKLMNESQSSLIAATQDPVNRIKAELNSWFVKRDQVDYFIGDSTTKGVCATPAGLNGGDGADFGNEVYTDHHFHYGYWLGAAGVVVDWDTNYNAQNQWIASLTDKGFKMKYAIDMLWRDTRNPDPSDPELPVSRHMDFWEGHSIANGFNTPPYASGRNEESLAEDYLCWINTAFYADAIWKSGLDSSDKQGFDYLRDYAAVGAQTTALSGKLYYRGANWIYAQTFQNDNIVTIGNQWDIAVDTQTFFPPN